MGIQLPRLTRCCFCFTLRTGSMIIGYISIVASILFIAAISFVTYKLVMFVEKSKDTPNSEHSPEELAKVALGVYVSQASYLLVYLYVLVISIVLVIGVHTDKPKLLKIYVFSGFFLFGMELALVVISVVFMGILASLPLLKWCLIHFFCLLVVKSAYLEMEEQKKPRAYEMHSLYDPERTAYPIS